MTVLMPTYIKFYYHKSFSIDSALVIIDPDTIPPVLPPTNAMVQRTAADVAAVTFEPQSLGVFQVDYYIADDPSSPDLVSV